MEEDNSKDTQEDPARARIRQIRARTKTISSSTYTRYFVTFELENGKRLEFGVKDPEYGMLAEGDHGHLSYQGTRYLGFERV